VIPLKEQIPDQIVDVAQFPKEWEAYPEGARVKATFVWPDTETSYPFCTPSWLYMFKTSRKAFPEQFWVEIFAYQLGCLVGVPVPPAFVAYDSNENIAGALIGNTDRHQGNWGIITKYIPSNENSRTDVDILESKLSPAFDNGTSMGHEIYEKNFHKYNNEKLEKYINDGKPHLMWDLNQKRSKHDNQEYLIKKMVHAYPECRDDMISCLQFSETQVKEIFQRLVRFEIEPRLSDARAKFMLDLLLLRQQKLLLALDN
jgi:hypothetical protein